MFFFSFYALQGVTWEKSSMQNIFALWWREGYFGADLSWYDMLVRMWMYLSWIFILLSPGICIILVHLLIKFKLHFLPESVAVVSLGKFYFFSKAWKLYFLHLMWTLCSFCFGTPSISWYTSVFLFLLMHYSTLLFTALRKKSFSRHTLVLGHFLSSEGYQGCLNT